MIELSDLTLEEKLSLLTGEGLWHTKKIEGLRQITMSDGPHGLRTLPEGGDHAAKAVAFPTLSALACTWNRALARETGELLGEEGIERGVDVLLAPGVNIKRSPYCGRNFEYFSEDPYLAGELAKAYVEGVQSKGVGACLKHFAANNREYDRFYVSSEVDERTLREIYLPAFRIALEAKPWMVMCAYNLLNGVYCSEHGWLLDDVLRKEWGFDGVVVSDWGAVVDRAKSLKAGLDLEMPYAEGSYGVLKAAYERGYISDEEIDRSVRRILALAERAEREAGKRTVLHTREERHEACVRIACESAVLLKNEGALPFEEGDAVVVGGKKAKTGVFGGGGSARVDSDFIPENLADLLKRENGALRVRYHECLFHDDGSKYGFFGLRGMIDLAARAQKALVVVGFDELTDAEGTDRTRLRLDPVEEDLILRTAEVNPNTVVLVYGGSAVDMSAWIDKVNAVVFANFNGEGGNEALAKLLTGRENFSGKLAESFFDEGENVRPNGSYEVYSEGIFVGYRGHGTPELPFGYGISYSRFVFSDLTCEKSAEGAEIFCTVKNVSSRAGKEVVQLYVGQDRPLCPRPRRELKGFEKVSLGAGEEKRVRFFVPLAAFGYWSAALKRVRVENGAYTVSVGSSSRPELETRLEILLDADLQPSQRTLSEVNDEF